MPREYVYKKNLLQYSQQHSGLTHCWLFEKHSAILCIRNEIEHEHMESGHRHIRININWTIAHA